MKMVTVKEISGSRIETIPKGTEVTVVLPMTKYGYFNVSRDDKKFPLSQVWDDEVVKC